VSAAAAGKAAPGAKAPKPTLAFRPDGTFKVMQFNDTQDDEQTDRRTIELMDRTLDAEKPDFVVINGDVINGDATRSWTSNRRSTTWSNRWKAAGFRGPSRSATMTRIPRSGRG
jgi:hypothetical protein